jgi:hypothetical protein
MGPVIVDTNLLLLLIVGAASRKFIRMHDRLSRYDEADFNTLEMIISLYSDIVYIPHIMAEVSGLSRQIKNPARRKIQETFREFIEAATEVPLPSRDGARRSEFHRFGLTDALLLSLCSMNENGVEFSLLTADGDLAVQAEMLGYGVVNFDHWR